MPDFTPEQKRFAARCQGEDLSPTETIKELKEEFPDLKDADIPTSQISRYNPTKAAGELLSADLKEVFYTARARYRAAMDDIPIAHSAFRQRELMRLYRANQNRSPIVAAAMLKQAAQEEGGMFSQRVNGAKPTAVRDFVAVMMSEVRDEITKQIPNEEERNRVLEAVSSTVDKHMGG
jgi:hypothetical protein